MKALLTILRTLSGSAALAGSATSTSAGPVELPDAQFGQVAGGGGALGGVIGSVINAANGSPAPEPDGSKGGGIGNMG